jgi:aminopeptidase N
MVARFHYLLLLGALLFPMGSKAEAPFTFATTPGKLPKTVVPGSYEIEINPDVAKKMFTGSETVTVDVREPTRTITLNAQMLAIHSAKLLDAQGQVTETAKVQIEANEETATLKFSKEIAAGTHRLALDFSGVINESGEGLFYATYEEEGSGTKKTMLGTQMEPTDARRLFPCWDEPSFRAKFRLTITVPASFTAVSNMPVENITKTPGGKRVRFEETPPMASYLVVLCAGELDAIHGEADGVKIGVVTTKGKAETGRYALESAEKILHYYDEYFGIKFPLPKLDLIAIPGGFGGAMENWGGITFYESALLFDPAKSSERTKEGVFGVEAHEMAHQWFGDLVTMAWWDNLWLNEGFASWMGTKCSDHFNPQWQVWLRADAAKQAAMATDALSATHPIQQPVQTEAEANSAFDEITYEKGQSFLRMLESYLGENDFRAGIRDYMQAHKYSNSTTADLWNALGEASKKPVASLAAGWTEQPGFPLVSTGAQTPDGLTISQEHFTIHQKNPAPLEWKIPIAWRDLGAATDSSPHVFLLEKKSDVLPGVGTEQTVKLNAGDVGYYRVAYDRAQFDKLLAAAPQLSSADKVNLLADTWALVEADKGPITDYFKLVEKLRDDDGLAQWEQISRTLDYIDSLYIGNDKRPAFQSYARSLLRPVFDRIGWEPKPNEKPTVGLLRVELIGALGDLGDEDIIKSARARFQKYVTDPKTLPPDLRPVVLEVVGRYADQKTWDTLHRLGEKTKSTEEKGAIYGAMAGAVAPELAQKTLALSLTDELPATRAVRLVPEVSFAGEQPALAWKYVEAHRAQLDKKLDSLGKINFAAGVMGGFSDASRADELEAFARKYLPPGAKRNVDKAAERIRFKADLKARLLPEINRWIEQRAK